MSALPTKILLGNRICGVSQVLKRQKAPTGQVWLSPQGCEPYPIKWPLRLHSETTFKVLDGIVEDIALKTQPCH